MINPSPMNELHEAADAVFTSFGENTPIVAEFEAHEIEYAALRRAVAVMDCPHRGLVQLTGDDRVDFLQRMVSGDVAGMEPGEARRCFLLTGKGRIMADLRVMHTDTATLVELDACDAPAFAQQMDTLLFTEDVQISDLSESYHCLAVYGPEASVDGDVAITAPLGTHLWVPAADAAERWRELLTAGAKPMGWQAYNIARIEAGLPLFHIDFGPTNLPHETGIVGQTCSFTKGCYRGQEVVARMQSLGHPGKMLVQFAAEGNDLPPAGAAVYGGDAPDADVVGAVTSSCHSPMRSGRPIGFAMVKWEFREEATLHAQTEHGRVPLTVEPIPDRSPSDG
jgi:folate-binding protein YgfZ